MATTALTKRDDPLRVYMNEVKRFPLLSREQEYAYALALRDREDRRAAQALVTANLRFVVKIAQQYHAQGVRVLDLVQEGNLGLMHAVKKFDPDRGYRLITYAVWWIRAYIQSYLVHSWSLVKLGTTQAQRKLFFRLHGAQQAWERDEAAATTPSSARERHREIASWLGVRSDDVAEMELRLSARDFSLDLALDEDGQVTFLDTLPDPAQESGEVLVFRQEVREQLRAELAEALGTLSEREREVIELRHFHEEPPTLREVGERWGVSRERARQVEASAREKLKAYLLDRSRVLRDVLPGLGERGLAVAG